MENNNKKVTDLKELQNLIKKAEQKATEMGETTKKTTLTRMIGVIDFDLFKLGYKETPPATPK